ncbi:MAG: hypothetical protein R2838_02545 [Caldilineaceae bacterium]
MRLLATLAFSHLLAGEPDAMVEGSQSGAGGGARMQQCLRGSLDAVPAALVTSAATSLPPRQCFEHAVDQRYVLHTMAAVDSLAGLAISARGAGRNDPGRGCVDPAPGVRRPPRKLRYVTIRMAQVRVMRLQGQADAAAQRLQTVDLSTDTGILFFFLEVPRLTACRWPSAGPIGMRSAGVRRTWMSCVPRPWRSTTSAS